ncbi:hypothetical protein [Sphingomonas sp. PAMC 26621]|uniref:hypothetical protein n=1 Tax=Sphingomonas sp. PAMC 26621 TaxID=1112213 RepID=UPI0002892770|nr:hypothetical protein [Sphingomonas sp. PAMC 26621]
MNHLALYDIATGAVVGTISADIVPEADAGFAYIEYDPLTDPRGWTVENNALVPASVPVTVSVPVRYTFNEWVDLFSLAEQVAIVTATMSDPLAKLIYDRAQSASGNIDPKDARTLEGLGYLVSKGWVSTATHDRIAAL